MNFLGKSVAITGHQPFILGGYDKDIIDKVTNVALEWIVKNQPSEVISGLAAGWDTAAADAALTAKIPLISALAFRSQADHWPEDAKLKHDMFIMKSEHVYVHAEEKEHGCYTKRDHWVLERGDIVLALWSGIDGGTARAVAKAKKMNKPVINLWEEWENIC